MTREQDIERALELIQQAVDNLNEVKVVLDSHHNYVLDFAVSRVYDVASSTAGALSYTTNELRRRTRDENTTID